MKIIIVILWGLLFFFFWFSKTWGIFFSLCNSSNSLGTCFVEKLFLKNFLNENLL